MTKSDKEEIQAIDRPSGDRLSGDKRSAILEAALARFFAQGYRRTSMEDIARDADIAKGTIYLYFKSKEELFLALSRGLLDQVRERIKAAAERDASYVDRVFGVLDAKLGSFYRWISSSPHAAELIDEKSRIGTEMFAAFDLEFRRTLKDLIEEGTRLGEIDPAGAGLSPAEAAETLLAAAYGAEHGPGGEAAHRVRLERIVRLAIRGLAA